MELFLALLPTIIMIILVLVTKRVILSLGVGITLGAFIYSDWKILKTLEYIFESFKNIVFDTEWYLPILGFVVIIGAITSVITLTGGTHAFAKWAVSKVKNRVTAQIIAWILGIIICIDDYFNALVIGEVSKPITDTYKVSRAKLSYIIDSTSAPVVILMPLSTWGAYIIGTLGELFEKSGYTKHTAFSGFVSTIPLQFYAIIAIIMVFIIVKYNINLGAMKKFEESALEGKDISKVESEGVFSEVKVEGTKGSHWALIVPIISLTIMTLFMMFRAAKFDITGIMDVDITIPLFSGGVVAYLVALVFALSDKSIKIQSIFKVTVGGLYEMVKSAVVILILAWMVSGVIDDLGTGELIAKAMGDSISVGLLPAILFIVAGLMAFATGTSWGAFSVLLPIAVPIAMATSSSYMILFVASVLGGAVLGDHCSPISDTTVLSATGARSTLHAHFISQIPYSLFAGGIATLGYLVYGLTGILILAYLIMGVSMFLFVKFLKNN